MKRPRANTWDNPAPHLRRGPTREQVMRAVELRRSGLTVPQIAAEMNVTPRYVWKLVAIARDEAQLKMPAPKHVNQYSIRQTTRVQDCAKTLVVDRDGLIRCGCGAEVLSVVLGAGRKIKRLKCARCGTEYEKDAIRKATRNE
jgi:hypothetical protein